MGVHFLAERASGPNDATGAEQWATDKGERAGEHRLGQARTGKDRRGQASGRRLGGRNGWLAVAET